METRTAPILPPNATAAVPQDQKKALAEVSFTQTPRVAAPLLSIAAAAYVLGLLYFPRYMLSFLLSPVAFFSTLLLAALLQYYLGFFPGAARPEDPQTWPPKSQHHPHRPPEDHQPPPPPPPSMEQRQHNYADAAPRGPLEIIYEEYEGEDEEEEEDGVGSPDQGRSGRRCQGLELLQLRRLCSRDDDESDDEGSVLSGRCSSSPRPWDSPANLCFHWEVEEDGLIEISLEEEDSLIEIDLSAPCR